MAKPMSLKQFINVDYTQTGDPQLAYNAKKRKRDSGEGTTEALTVQQRRKLAISLKKNKAKIARGRKIAARKVANMDTLKKRARRQARKAIVKKITKGIDKSELSVARRAEIEKRVDKMGSRIDRIAKKLLPKVRKSELARKRGPKKSD